MVYDNFLWKETFEKGWADGYFFKETVNLDFDIIDVTFTKNLKNTVIPVVSSPIDVVPSPTPPPDIMIRTGGEIRLSNFLLWQLAYSELFFVDKYWPDFQKEDLDDIIKAYKNRDRRFGGIKNAK